MGLFFESQPLVPTLSTAFEHALKANPVTILNPAQEATNRANQIREQVSGKFSWPRVGLALFIWAALLVGSIYTALHNLADISNALLHSFETFSGLVVGLLGGEALGRR